MAGLVAGVPTIDSTAYAPVTGMRRMTIGGRGAMSQKSRTFIPPSHGTATRRRCRTDVIA
jgi:hypothetical protein